MLTARDDELDKLLGLELGADDYLTKPFSPRELVARVRAVLRRVDAHADHAADEVIRAGDVVLDVPRMRAEVDGPVVELTPTEFQLLATLARQPGPDLHPVPAPRRRPRRRLRVVRAGDRHPHQEPPPQARARSAPAALRPDGLRRRLPLRRRAARDRRPSRRAGPPEPGRWVRSQPPSPARAVRRRCSAAGQVRDPRDDRASPADVGVPRGPAVPARGPPPRLGSAVGPAAGPPRVVAHRRAVAAGTWQVRPWRGFGCLFGLLFVAAILGVLALAIRFVGDILGARPGGRVHPSRGAARPGRHPRRPGPRRVRDPARPAPSSTTSSGRRARVEAGDYTARVESPATRSRSRPRPDPRASTRWPPGSRRTRRQRRTLLADVTHELRTPLAVVQGNVEAILDGVHPADDGPSRRRSSRRPACSAG